MNIKCLRLLQLEIVSLHQCIHTILQRLKLGAQEYQPDIKVKCKPAKILTFSAKDLSTHLTAIEWRWFSNIHVSMIMNNKHLEFSTGQ